MSNPDDHSLGEVRTEMPGTQLDDRLDAPSGTEYGSLYAVATPIGNLEDMTFRAIRVLGDVDVIAAEDTRTVLHLLTHFNIRRPQVLSLFEGNEAARASALIARLHAGRSVALVSEAGMPGISDPGQRVIAAAIEAGIRVEVIPGAVAAISALVGSGLTTDQFMYIGFPPRTKGARRRLFGSLARQPATLILYESPERVGVTLADLVDAFGGGRRVALARELTKRFEEYARGTLAEVAARYRDQTPRGECTLVVEGCRDEGGDVPEDDIEARMRALLDSGLGPKDAAARLMVVTGKPRRALYQLALSLKRRS